MVSMVCWKFKDWVILSGCQVIQVLWVMEEKELVPIRFFLSKEEKLEFRKICLEENTTMKDKVREIICDYVENQKEEKKKK